MTGSQGLGSHGVTRYKLKPARALLGELETPADTGDAAREEAREERNVLALPFSAFYLLPFPHVGRTQAEAATQGAGQ